MRPKKEEPERLDAEGIDILLMMRGEIPEAQIEYYSTAMMERIAV